MRRTARRRREKPAEIDFKVQVSVSLVRIILGSLDEFVRPGVDDGVAIDVLDAEHDAFLELLLRRDPDVAQDRASD